MARRALQLLERDRSELRIVSRHLGAGASLCATAGGRSVDTTMGFTPLEGLVMTTRSGSVDPGLLLWLIERTGMLQAELAASLEHESGSVHRPPPASRSSASGSTIGSTAPPAIGTSRPLPGRRPGH